MEGKIKSESQSNKMKICLRVKKTVYQLVELMNRKLGIFGLEDSWTDHLKELLVKWRKELALEIDEEI